MPGSKITLYAINGNAGAFVDIPATQITRYVLLVEDDSVAARQGLDFKTPDDAFVAVKDIGPTAEPIVLGTAGEGGIGAGSTLGWPANTSGGSSRAADVLIKLRSKTATATTVRVTEYS